MRKKNLTREGASMSSLAQTQEYVDSMLREKDLMIKRLEFENERLFNEKKQLEDKLLSLLDPEAFYKYKLASQEKKNGQASRPKIVDNGKLREKTDIELAQDFQALQELGIL